MKFPFLLEQGVEAAALQGGEGRELKPWVVEDQWQDEKTRARGFSATKTKLKEGEGGSGERDRAGGEGGQERGWESWKANPTSPGPPPAPATSLSLQRGGENQPDSPECRQSQRPAKIYRSAVPKSLLLEETVYFAHPQICPCFVAPVDSQWRREEGFGAGLPGASHVTPDHHHCRLCCPLWNPEGERLCNRIREDSNS